MKRGFTLIEVLITLMVLTIVEMAIYSGFQFSMKSMRYAKAKTNAVGLANEKMEELRNLPYDNLSTAAGLVLPHGAILDSQTIVKSGTKYTVLIDIRYVDDPYDGVATGPANGKPMDTYPIDYIMH